MITLLKQCLIRSVVDLKPIDDAKMSMLGSFLLSDTRRKKILFNAAEFFRFYFKFTSARPYGI